MSYCSAFDSTFLSTVEQWIDAKGEVLAMIRFAYSAGAKSFEFYDSFSAFNIRFDSYRLARVSLYSTIFNCSYVVVFVMSFYSRQEQ
jgi:hypothetical protein